MAIKSIPQIAQESQIIPDIIPDEKKPTSPQIFEDNEEYEDEDY